MNWPTNSVAVACARSWSRRLPTAASWWTLSEFPTRLDPTLAYDTTYILVDLDGHPVGLLAVSSLVVDRRRSPDATRRRNVARLVPPLAGAADTRSSGNSRAAMRLRGDLPVVVEDSRCL